MIAKSFETWGIRGHLLFDPTWSPRLMSQVRGEIPWFLLYSLKHSKLKSFCHYEKPSAMISTLSRSLAISVSMSMLAYRCRWIYSSAKCRKNRRYLFASAEWRAYESRRYVPCRDSSRDVPCTVNNGQNSFQGNKFPKLFRSSRHSSATHNPGKLPSAQLAAAIIWD